MINIVAVLKDLALIKVLKSVILHEPDWSFLKDETDYPTFLNNLPKRARIDVAILDASEIDHIRDFKMLSHQVKCVVVTEHEVQMEALRAFHSGAVGYLDIDDFKKAIPDYIKMVIAGGVLISPLIARFLIDSLTVPISESNKNTNNYHLTPKEIEVIHLISMGYSYDKMAKVLNISKNGVRFHVRNIYAKLNVNNRSEATRKWDNLVSALDSQKEA